MEVGKAINQIIAGKDLSKTEAYQVFEKIMKNETNPMMQGGFLAALTAKGATAEEISALYRVIYDLDTVKVAVQTKKPLVENSGTGMDVLKTFNISTAASIVAAACGAALARHGSRGITSKCGTVDVCETLGINVEAEPEMIGKSIETCGLGLFNGMSPKVHPKGLARILSQLKFGTVLNIAASLANPAAPQIGVRGVNNPNMIESTAAIMAQMGYQRVLVFHGFDGENRPAMDEISVLGRTDYILIDAQKKISRGSFEPEDFGFIRKQAEGLLTGGNVCQEAKRLIRILKGEGTDTEREAVILNAAAILWTAELSDSMIEGCKKAAWVLDSKAAWRKLIEWVSAQSAMTQDEAENYLALLWKGYAA